ncbi:MAG: ATP-binding cassette domain-containing protein [Candidatus Limnocylindria bacterium]
MEALASLRGVTVVLDDRAVVRGVDLSLGPGLCILRGPNGAGKTTLLRAIAGLVPIAAGTREIRGDLLALGHRPQLLRGLSASENLIFFQRFRGRTGSPSVIAALAAWGLAADLGRSVESLSAGQRRRAALARIDTEPCALTLLDEPFAELDEDAAALLRVAIERARAAGRAVVVATHGHPELDERASAVMRIESGQVVA